MIGEVVINDPKKSVTKETTNKFVRDVNIGFGITDLASQSGTAHTIYTQVDHGLIELLASVLLMLVLDTVLEH